ncbi:hypothetical protein ES708_33811 [subsurface metagenome]
MWEITLFLFPSFVACVVLLAILGYLGLHVLEREIIFIDITLAQIAALGSVLAVILAHQNHDDPGLVTRLFSIGCTIAAAAFFSFIAKNVKQISHETLIGVTYAIAAAAMLFVLSLSTGSDIHLEEMLTGSILWLQWSEILSGVVVFSIIGLFHYIFRKQFIEISQDYHGSLKKGNNTIVWDFLFYASMGIVITYTVEMAGVLLTFAFLIIPATFSTLFSKHWGKRMAIAGILGMTVSIAGLLFSYRFDFSCGPTIVAIMGLTLVGAVFVKKIFCIA